MSTIEVLVAEEDAATRAFLADNLTADGFEVYTADSAVKALALMRTRELAVIVVDVNGETLGVIEGNLARVPLLVLGSGEQLDVVRKLERGADDYMPKPFSYPELRARVNALLRRIETRGTRTVAVTNGRATLTIDRAAHAVRVDDQTLVLSGKEYALLLALALDPGRVFTKAELLRDVWGYRVGMQTRTLDSHAHRLRAKLTAAGFERALVNVWGVGYRLCDAL